MSDAPPRPRPRVLLVDDETTLRESLAEVLREEGMDVVPLGDGDSAVRTLDRQTFDLVISDIKMPGTDGLTLLRKIHESRPGLGVILITAFGSVDSAVEAMKLGATDYIVKPLLFDDLLMKIRRVLQFGELRRENRQLRAEVEFRPPADFIVGNSPEFREIMALVDKVAQTRANVLVVGESGTGKELIARAIHHRGITAGAPFVPVNCGGIPETLIESEMFGHRRGAFTGAIRDKIGFFEAADGGTLFLDEVGNLPMSAQMALLRAIEQKSVVRVGDTKPLQFDLRIISATNRDPADLVREGSFREDLYFRLNVVQISLPPLRKRVEDIGPLVEHFIRKYNIEMKRQCTGIRPDALKLLTAQPWKGNIRELENVIERALIFVEDREIAPDDLPFLGSSAAGRGAPTPLAGSEPIDVRHDSLESAVRQYERTFIGRILADCGYDKNLASRKLGISVPSLYRKLKDLGLPLQESNGHVDGR
ncbi:MAG: sigma-54 dependent transcriptional regulator [Phycisphaerae bacterium]|nr:sigma-54 dependent transcriptional regulator [Phycisphaerae bacterium]